MYTFFSGLILRKTILRFIHTVVHINNLFLSIAEEYFTIIIY